MDVLVIPNTPSNKFSIFKPKNHFKTDFFYELTNLHCTKKRFFKPLFSTRKLQMAVTLRPCCRIFRYFLHYIRRNLSFKMSYNMLENTG